MPEAAAKPRAFKVILPLALLFFVPLLAAYAIFFHFPEWIPEGRTHHGVLVSPARPAPAFAASLKGRWSFVYVAGGECAESCRRKLAQIRQIRLALNEKRVRVQYVLAGDAPVDATFRAEHPELVLLTASAGAARAFFTPTDADALYLLDPLGNWLMSYPAAAESRGIFKDIKKLLRLSQIG